MKEQEQKGTENSTQLIDLIVQAYTSLKCNQTFSFSRIPIKAQQSVQQAIQSKFFSIQQKSKIIHFKNDRLLFEIETPYAELELEDSIYGQLLSEQDLNYLLSTGFSDWKLFLINQHYRVELNINDPYNHPIPLQNGGRPVEPIKQDIASEVMGDIRVKILPKDAEEKRSLERAQEQVNKWFAY